MDKIDLLMKIDSLGRKLIYYGAIKYDADSSVVDLTDWFSPMFGLVQTALKDTKFLDLTTGIEKKEFFTEEVLKKFLFRLEKEARKI